MLRTEKQSSFSGQTDYYQQWLKNNKKIKNLEYKLLDSKKVIRTLHLKWIDVLKSIKVFEESLDFATSDLEKEYGSFPNTSKLLADTIVSEMVVESHPSNLQGIRSELVGKSCGQEIMFANAGPPQKSQTFSVMSDSLPKSNDVKEQGSQNKTYTTLPVNDQINVSGEEVKDEQCNARGNGTVLLSEVISVQELQTGSFNSCPEIQIDHVYPEFTFKVEDNQLKDEEEQISKTDFQNQESKDATNTIVPREITVSSEQVKGEQSYLTGYKSELLCEVISENELETESVDTTSKINFDHSYSELIFEVEDKNEPKDGMERNSSSNFKAEAEVRSNEKKNRCSILAMNVFDCYKYEPMEELNNDTLSNANVVATSITVPTENIHDISLKDQLSSQVTVMPKPANGVASGFISDMAKEMSSLPSEQKTEEINSREKEDKRGILSRTVSESYKSELLEKMNNKKISSSTVDMSKCVTSESIQVALQAPRRATQRRSAKRSASPLSTQSTSQARPQKRMYYIVEFLISKEVDIVPSDWCNEEETKCFCPPQKPGFNISKAVLKNLTPEGGWESFAVRIIYKSENYNKAREKLQISEGTSDLSTENQLSDDDNGIRTSSRKRIRPSRFVDDSPERQTFCRFSSSHAEQTDGARKTFNLLEAPPLPFKSSCQNNKGFDSSSLTKVSCSTLPASRPTSLGSKINGTAEVMAGINKIFGTLQDVTFSISNLNTVVSSLLNKEPVQPVNSEDILALTPLKTQNDIEAFEVKLEDKNFRSKVVTFLSSVGGRDAADATRKVAGRLITNRAADLYNWAGRGEKLSFSSLKLRGLIIDCVRKNVIYKDTPQLTIENAIKNWLKLSKLRGVLKLRVNNQLAITNYENLNM